MAVARYPISDNYLKSLISGSKDPYFKQQTFVKFKEKLTIVNHQFVN